MKKKKIFKMDLKIHIQAKDECKPSTQQKYPKWDYSLGTKLLAIFTWKSYFKTLVACYTQTFYVPCNFLLSSTFLLPSIKYFFLCDRAADGSFPSPQLLLECVWEQP